MIKTLLIKNLILIKHADISFEEGLTIFTGETGAGKTAFIQALRLILGERADASKIRKGCDKAFIQASFEINLSPNMKRILEEAGVEHSIDEDLILTREISLSGKSRAFICGQLAPLSTIQKLASYLVDFVSQHEQLSLKSGENQRDLLDQYCQLNLLPFNTCWDEEKKLEKQLNDLLTESHANENNILEDRLTELEKLNYQTGEETVLFEEYTLLNNSQEIQLNSTQALASLEKAIDCSVEVESLVKSISKYTTQLSDGEKMGIEAKIQLTELRSLIESFSAKVEFDPTRLDHLEERLKQIDRLKKKYKDDLEKVRLDLKEQLKRQENIHHLIETTNEELAAAKKNTTSEAARVTEIRMEGARDLEKELSLALQELNIPSAEVRIQIDKTSRSPLGEDSVSFCLKANRGEQLAALKDSTSGGELSRILFALKVILSQKSNPQTMIFDEIDANVGGKTGTIMGQKLAHISKTRQVFCITHFPQVARYGNHHYRVYKEEKADRTECTIEPLKPKNREVELLRMLGGDQLKIEASPLEASKS